MIVTVKKPQEVDLARRAYQNAKRSRFSTGWSRTNISAIVYFQNTMSHFFPSAEYAEDQPLARIILATHVLSRGFQLGTAVGLLSSSAEALNKSQSIISPILLRSAGAGGAIGAGITGIGLIAHMWGRGEIEWKDRSWRLRYNSDQLAIDNWSEPAAALGVLTVVLRRPSGVAMGGWRRLVGGAGIGSLVGVVGCMFARRMFLSQNRQT